MATPVVEDHLCQLATLRSRGTIAADEYAIMRRLVEGFDPARSRIAPIPKGPGEAPALDPRSLVTLPVPTGQLTAAWVAGSWTGRHTGGSEWI